MKSHTFLILISLILGQDICAQNWKINVGESDFDGKYTSAINRGTGGAYPYNSPALIINRFNDGSINFYLTDFGYAGCQGNEVVFLFDKSRKYEGVFTVNEENNILFFKSFFKDDNVVINEQVYNELLKSQRLALRVSNSCFSRDYVFNLSGSSSAIDKVIGLKRLNAVIENLKMESTWQYKVDSLYQFISYPNNAVNKLTPELLFRMEFFERNNKRNYYSMKREDALFLVELALSYIGDNYRNMVTNKRTGQLVLATDDTIMTPYYVKVVGDSMRVELTREQECKEQFIKDNLSWIGYPGANTMRLLDIIEFCEYSSNYNSDLMYRISLAIGNKKKYLLFVEPSKSNPTTGVLLYSMPWMTEKFVIKEFSRLYETLEMKENRRLEQLRREDSVKDWLSRPDTLNEPYSWEAVDSRPKVDNCTQTSLKDCFRDFIVVSLRDILGEDVRKYTKPFSLKVYVNYKGEISFLDVVGVSTKRTEQIRLSSNKLRTVTPPRKSGRVCNMIVELQLEL